MFALIAALATGTEPADPLPPQVLQEVEYAREICRSLGHQFRFDPDYIAMADFNLDGTMDYVVDGRAFFCMNFRMTATLYGGPQGHVMYVYVSDGKGDWEKAFNGRAYEYRISPKYMEAPYFDAWIRGEVGYKINYVRYQWMDSRFEVVEQESGVEVPTQLWKEFD